MRGLAIKDVADRTGIAAGTIRQWEQRYGFPEPPRTPSGYRVYSEEDVDTLRRIAAFRERGLSVPAAINRARRWVGPSDRPSLFGAVMAGERAPRPHVLRKPTMLAISRAIEDETLARAARPLVFGAFQEERHYRPVEHRYRRIAANADAVVVLADFKDAERDAEGPVELSIERETALGNEWAVVVDAPGYAALLIGWEQPESASDRDRSESDRRFEAIWTLDPDVVRRAARAGVEIARRHNAALGERLDALVADRPLAADAPAPGLVALTNRIVAYMERT